MMHDQMVKKNKNGIIIAAGNWSLNEHRREECETRLLVTHGSTTVNLHQT